MLGPRIASAAPLAPLAPRARPHPESALPKAGAFRRVLTGMSSREREPHSKSIVAPTRTLGEPGITPGRVGGRAGPFQGDGAHDREAAAHAATRRDDADDPLDGTARIARHAAQLAPPIVPAPPSVGPLDAMCATRPVAAVLSLEDLLPAMVRRVAFRGDRHVGSIRLELGAGPYEGAVIHVHADHGRLRVELGGLAAEDLDGLRSRVDARLRGAGLDFEMVG